MIALTMKSRRAYAQISVTHLREESRTHTVWTSSERVTSVTSVTKSNVVPDSSGAKVFSVCVARRFRKQTYLDSRHFVEVDMHEAFNS